MLEIVQQSLMRASLTAFTSSIKTAASAFFLPINFAIFLFLHSGLFISCISCPPPPHHPAVATAEKDADFHTVTASQETEHKWLTLNYLDDSHDLLSSYLLFCSSIFFVPQNCQCKPHTAGTTASTRGGNWPVFAMLEADWGQEPVQVG